MLISPAYLAELAQPGLRLDLWIEIEGVPHAFGLTPRDAAWYGARLVELRRERILGSLLDLPTGVEQEVRPYEAQSSIGQLTISILDDDAGIARGLYANTARTDDWGRLTADLDAPAAASMAPATVDVPMTAPLATVVGGYLYVGRETMKVVALPAPGVVRVYRGMARPPTPIDARAYRHTAGDVVTTYPRFLATRRAYLYSAPLDGSDADKVARWSGSVVATKLRQGLAGIDLTLESLESVLRAKCFTGQIRGKLSVGMADPDGRFDRDESEPDGLRDRVRLEPSSVQGRGWVNGERVTFRVGDELLSGRLVVPGWEIVFDGAHADDGRGLWGTRSEQHDLGDELREVILVVARNTTGSIEERVSRFLKGDGPLDLVLQFLLSLDGTAANGAYDVLPQGWGLGIDQGRFDLEEIADTAARWLPAAREIRLIDEPFLARDLIASVLRTHLCYPVTKLDDRLTFRFLGPPMPDAPARAVDAGQVLAPPAWASGEDRVVGRMLLRCDIDAIDGETRQTYKGEFQGPGVEAQEFYAGHFDTLTIEAPGQWSGNDPGAAKFGARLSTDAETTALRHFDLVRDRRARAFPELELEAAYDALDVVPGDVLSVTLASVPDVRTGSQDLVAGNCEVRRKTVDDRRARVTLSVTQVPYGERYRLIAPSAVITVAAVGSVATVAAHEFTDPARAKTDSAHFPVGAMIAIWSPDLRVLRGTGQVTAIGDTSIAWGGGDIAVQAGDVILLGDLAEQGNGIRDRFAFLVDGSAARFPLLPDGTPAHEFTP